MDKLNEIIKILKEATDKLKPYENSEVEVSWIVHSIEGTLFLYISMIEAGDENAIRDLTHLIHDFLHNTIDSEKTSATIQ